MGINFFLLFKVLEKIAAKEAKWCSRMAGRKMLLLFFFDVRKLAFFKTSKVNQVTFEVSVMLFKEDVWTKMTIQFQHD